VLAKKLWVEGVELVADEASYVRANEAMGHRPHNGTIRHWALMALARLPETPGASSNLERFHA